MSGINRIQGRGKINRGTALRFYFNGRQYFGHRGDTLASALLANGVMLVGRSFKYHRPRGIFSAGVEEPNALVQLEEGAYTQPNIKATEIELYNGLVARSQNCWPSVRFDIGAINSLFAQFLPAGFYYKTFMWPASFWMTYEHFIRKAAGLGVSPRTRDPDRYEQRYAHCEVLIVGSGPAGLSAALAAGRSGVDVIVIEQQSEFGGDLLSATPENAEHIDDIPVADWLKSSLQELQAMAHVRMVPRCTVSGYHDYNFLTALERVTDHLDLGSEQRCPRQKLWKIRAKRVVLCTGSLERPLLFSDNDRPGVMLADAIRTYVNRYRVLPAQDICLFTNNDSAYRTALDCQRVGARITVVDVREKPEGRRVRMARDAGVEVLPNSAITGVIGRRKVKAVEVRLLDASGKAVVGAAQRIACQVVGSSGGWNPTVHLFSQARGRLQYDMQVQSFVPLDDTFGQTNRGACAGAVTGEQSIAACLRSGFLAGVAVAESLAYNPTDSSSPRCDEQTEGTMRALWTIPPEQANRNSGAKQFHDMQNDVTVADIRLAAQEGYESVEHLKRYTTTGMATDQGKTSNVNALAVLAELRGINIEDLGTTTFRPPYTPVTFGAIAGQNRAELFLQERITPMHPWHEGNGAVFEDVGDWKRPRYFPRDNEDMHQCVQREARQVRTAVGMLDASTLGKIDIQGPDSLTFLNRIYTNDWTSLGIGKCRYGLMLNEHGMVFDDGVTTCLGEHHYHMTTTTGGAARVLNWMEEWLQTEWPQLKVYCTSVTEQWAVVALNGPRARDLLSQLTDLELSNTTLPHMSYAETQISGIPARIFRISFTGELAYEINVPARFGLALWEVLVNEGRRFGLCVYGTETMHLLRAEKGFVIVGQDTDGTVTPYDLGMGWIVSKSKSDFLGKRSLSRSDTARADRKQLVGVLTETPDIVLPEGAHLVTQHHTNPPIDTEGHITSSYYSPNLGRSIALALVKTGKARHGDSATVCLMDGQRVPVMLTETAFLDRAGERLQV